MTQANELQNSATRPDSRNTINKFWDSFVYRAKQKLEWNSYEETLFYPENPYPSKPYWAPAHKTKLNPVGFEELK